MTGNLQDTNGTLATECPSGVYPPLSAEQKDTFLLFESAFAAEMAARALTPAPTFPD